MRLWFWFYRQRNVKCWNDFLFAIFDIFFLDRHIFVNQLNVSLLFTFFFQFQFFFHSTIFVFCESSFFFSRQNQLVMLHKFRCLIFSVYQNRYTYSQFHFHTIFYWIIFCNIVTKHFDLSKIRRFERWCAEIHRKI